MGLAPFSALTKKESCHRSGINYHLQAATVLANPTWATVWSNVPGKSPVTLPAWGGGMFFRLVCP